MELTEAEIKDAERLRQLMLDTIEVHMNSKRCPVCDSPSPHLHPAVQYEGEVEPCRAAWHDRWTPQNPKGTWREP